MVTIIVVFVIALVIGLPIAFVIGLTGLAHISTFANPAYFDVFIQKLVSGVNSNSYLCIPLFVLAGNIMNRGGITERLLNFLRQCIGWIRGGMAYAATLVGILLSAILGSSNAVASLLCTTVVPELRKDGFDDEFSVAVCASSGILGPIIPPGTSMVIMAVMTGVSVKSVFYSGIVPGLLIGIAFMVVTTVLTRKRNYPKSIEKFSGREWGKSLWKSLASLLVPFVIIIGVTAGIFTPSEAGVIAVAIALITGFAYKTLKVKDLPKIFINSVFTSAGIMFIVAFGNVLGWTFAMDGIPAKIANSILGVTTSRFGVLCIIIGIMLVVGFFMEGYSAMMIFGPVFAVVANMVGIDMIQYCMLFVIIINIGLLTPPVGMILFVSSNICDIPLSRISKAIWPFVVAAVIAIFILMAFPQLVTFLPSLIV